MVLEFYYVEVSIKSNNSANFWRINWPYCRITKWYWNEIIAYKTLWKGRLIGSPDRLKQKAISWFLLSDMKKLCHLFL